MRIKPLRFIAALILAAIGVGSGFAQQGQSYLQRWIFASDFGQYSIRSQTSGTYSWNPGSICQIGAVGTAPQFFAFATTEPVEIVDLTNPALNEIATPSAVTNTNSSCGFTASLANTHYGFFVTSGTGGLQEAVNAVSSTAPYTTIIWIDRNWYALANALPSPTTPASILAALTGNANALIVDNTTSPFTYYAWNGTKYSANLAPTAFPNKGVTSYTNISAPTAVSTSATTYGILTTATTGGTIPASSTYRLGITYVDASGGETTLSTDSASTATIATGSGTATNTITVTSPAAATGAVGYRIYMTAASGSSLAEILYTPTCSSTSVIANQSVFPAATVCPIGASATITAVVTGTSVVPQVNTAFPRTAQTSLSFAPFPATAIAANTNVIPLGTINLPAGYLNSLGRSFTICGDEYSVTGTEGVITLTGTITTAGVVGTNSTLYTAAQGSSGSTTLPIATHFCVTYTTAAVSTSATSTAGALEVHGWQLTSVTGTVAGTAYKDIRTTTVGSLNLWVAQQLAFNVTGDGTVVSATTQLRQLEVTPYN